MKAINFLVLLIVSLAVVHAAPVWVEKAYVNDFEVWQNQTVRLNVEKGGVVDVRVLVLASQNMNNVEVKALVTGFDGNKVVKIQDETELFDMDAQVTYPKYLRLTLPDDVDIDSYKLRIIVSDRNSETVVANYNLKIDADRHAVKVKDVLASPGFVVKSGSSFIAKVRLENRGQVEERNARVEVSIPQLSLSQVGFVNKIRVNDDAETEELLLRLPKCASAGVYSVNVKVWYNENRNSIEESKDLQVLENEACREQSKTVVVEPPAQLSIPPAPAAPKVESTWSVRKTLEVLLLVLVALLVVIGLVIGFSRMKMEE